MPSRKRTFKQARSRETYEHLIATAARAFARRGYEATQTAHVAEEAGVSTGAVYRYFKDKRELFLEMLETHLHRGRQEVSKRLQASNFDLADLRGAIGSVIDAIFEQVKKDAAIGRVYLAMTYTDRDVAALRARTETEDRLVIATMIREAIPRSRVADPMAAALVIQSAALGAAIECYVTKTVRTPDSHVKAALTLAIHRYLFGEPPGR